MEGNNYRRIGVTLEEALELMGEAVGDGKRRAAASTGKCQAVSDDKCRAARGRQGPDCREENFQELPLKEALGRILGCDYVSPIDQPPFPRSPLDGYALRSADTAGASREHPVRLAVTQGLLAGEYPKKTVERGQAARIMTGAPIPEGADCVVRQEDTDYGEETAAIYRELAPYDNYCFAGEDFHRGDCLLTAGTRLTAVELGILAGMGYDRVKVYRRIRAAVFATGDELTQPGEPLSPGKIYNSNLYVLEGRLTELGIETVETGVLPDTEQGVAGVLEGILPRVDVIFTTGGVSVGKKDILHGALDLLGVEKIFWRVQVKPGTPTIFAMAGRVPVLALSGNPFGALTHLELLGRPLLALLSGDSSLEAPKREAVLMDDFSKGGKMRRIVRVFYREGKVYLPKGLHSSGVLGSMQGCNCLMEIPAGSEGLLAGAQVSVLLLRRGEAAPGWAGSGGRE